MLALCPAALDRGRALAIAVVHDLAEVRVGDLTPHDAVAPADKRARERDALRGLLAPLGARGHELRALWREYEAESSSEGRFVKACDKLDMALQACRYRQAQGAATDEFITSALARLEPGLLRALAGARSRGASAAPSRYDALMTDAKPKQPEAQPEPKVTERPPAAEPAAEQLEDAAKPEDEGPMDFGQISNIWTRASASRRAPVAARRRPRSS